MSPGQQQVESVDKHRECNRGRHGLTDAQIDGVWRQGRRVA